MKKILFCITILIILINKYGYSQKVAVISTNCGYFPSTQILDSCPFVSDIEINDLISKSNLLLEVFPEEIFALKELEYLTINNSIIKSIPYGIVKLKNLKIIHIGKSNISEIPYFVSSLDSLVSLTVSNSKIIKVSSEIGNMKQLENLSLYGNPLLNMDTLFNILTNSNITEISIGHWRLKRIPFSIIKLHKLENLGIKNCKNLDCKNMIQQTHLMPKLKNISFFGIRVTRKMINQLKGIRENIDIEFLNCYGDVKLIAELETELKGKNKIYIGGKSKAPSLKPHF